VYIRITPDENLRQFRFTLAQTLRQYCKLRSYDLDSAEEFKFHATVAMKLDWFTLLRIFLHFFWKRTTIFRHQVIRVTLLQNARIIYEYDFIQDRLLTRAQALSRGNIRKDFELLKS
jgi:hypothetical protein